MFIGGFMIAFPGTTPAMGWISTIIGAAITAATAAILILARRAMARRAATAS